MCGIFGAYSVDKQPVLEEVYLGLFALQHRGQLSAGTAWIEDGKTLTHKGVGLVHEALNQYKLSKIKASYAIGHVRYATAGGTSYENSQPLVMNSMRGPVALAHNGNLTNAQALISFLENNGAIFHTTSDTETILQLMAHEPNVSYLEAFEHALPKIQGAYSLVVLFEDTLVAARDPWGFRPLILGKKDNTYYVTSESCALDMIGAKIVRDIEPGEILIISGETLTSKKIPVSPSHHCICAFEYVYFARQDSVIDGVSVYHARKRLGAELVNHGIPEGDIVVTGMPDSGTIAAMGLAQKSGKKFENGVVRNRFVGRTFIQPTQRVRAAGVKIKLNPQTEVFKDKEAIVVDDSIVRGTTAGRIVSMIKESGAKKVHMRISSPPVRFPCYYGIDTPSSEELIAAQMEVRDLCKEISADSLEYITCDELAKAIGIPRKDLCTACFDGRYLDPEEDIEE